MRFPTVAAPTHQQYTVFVLHFLHDCISSRLGASMEAILEARKGRKRGKASDRKRRRVVISLRGCCSQKRGLIYFCTANYHGDGIDRFELFTKTRIFDPSPCIKSFPVL